MKQLHWFEGSLWSGMHLVAWLRLLVHNRFAISPRRIPLALGITLLAIINSALRCWQQLRYRRQLR